MKLIIDIPDYKLDEVQNGSIASNEILKAVRKGTPISTEGDLISREALRESFSGYTLFTANTVIEHINNAPTINTENCDDCPYCPKS